MRRASNSCDDVGATHRFVIYGGQDEFCVGNGITVIALAKFMKKLAG